MKNTQLSDFSNYILPGLLLSVFQLAGCVGSTGGSFQVEEQFIYAGGSEQTGQPVTKAPSSEVAPQGQKQLLKVYDTLLSTEALNTDVEEALGEISSVNPESRTKLQKAILVLAASRLAITEKEDSETDLDDNSQKLQEVGQFESNLQRFSVVLTSELQTNSFLQTANALKWIAAASKAAESKSFSDRIQAQLIELKNSWTQIIGESDIPDENDLVDQAEPDTSLPVPANYGSLEDGEAVLEKAEELAAEGKLLEAVRLLEALPEDSPFRETADEQIIEWSNKGVRRLRSLAARDFQKALPIANSQTKQEYLMAAKTHLEKARKNFPKSEQLQAVDENLKVIDQNLSGLSQP